ncbi:MAG: hypothetical protein HZC18_02485 [Candidatus Omnitrophica bacterium]|nr:hypothetical protein [Candidatus Omnitrophota bacterium]
MPLMNSATGFRAHRMLEVVVKGITLIYYLSSRFPMGQKDMARRRSRRISREKS